MSHDNVGLRAPKDTVVNVGVVSKERAELSRQGITDKGRDLVDDEGESCALRQTWRRPAECHA